MALAICLRSDFLSVLRTWASCLEGLMATMVIPARIAMIPTTNKISKRVNPFLAFKG